MDRYCGIAACTWADIVLFSRAWECAEVLNRIYGLKDGQDKCNIVMMTG